MSEIFRKRKQYTVLSVLLCLVTVFGIFQYKRANELEYMQEIEYNRVFSELTEYVDDIEISLLKGQLVQSPPQMAKLSAELYRRASAAKANLALLPVGETHLEKTSEFLSQVGEYANSISAKLLRGENMTDEEIKTIKELTGYASHLSRGFDNMLEEMNNGNLSFADEKKKMNKIMDGGRVAMASELAELEEEFHDYPSLIYDGPFSQHLTLKKSAFTKGKPEITQKQALNKAKEIFGDEQYDITEVGGTLPSYSIKSETTTVELTKNGGILLLMMKDKIPGDKKISVNKAKKRAVEFLAENGFENMKESYFDNREGSIIINYSYNQNGYTVYPDLVKVKVSLENGEILGFESRGYIMNHVYRDIPDVKISRDEALKKINSSLETENVSLAVIPLESGNEACCYQIKGKVSDKHFLVFVNTSTGYIEDIQILLETKNGTLTV